MNDQRWEEVLRRLDKQFGDLEFDEIEDEATRAVVESVVWKGPAGRMKLTRTTRPLILDSKRHFSNRAGAGSHVEYTFSKTEISSKVRLYKWSEPANDWEELDASLFEDPKR
ncbi:MAG TPA: hypothetical protein VFM17_03955 [Candidatus Eisenbacteria bacterium]|jgi:hypothetical protein|nr:hypothetical protein [Candidatus Eisenbacteria bacterium]HEU4333250.1 hypothetical protein [Candidatus Eisenbacteria bacterium]